VVDAANVSWCYLLRPARPGFLVEPTDDEQATMASHVAYLGDLLEEGKLVLAGPSIDGEQTFGIVVLECDEDGARAAMESDPAVQDGVMTARLQPFRIALLRGRDEPQ
jgi:uncharacterized protein YciI